MLKIVILGPESSGKTTLSAQLAKHYGGVVVPEFAREFLEKRGGKYDQNDLLQIVNGQIENEQNLTTSDVAMMFLDTDLTVVKVWSEVKFGSCRPEILTLYQQRKYDYYLLTYPDLKWEPDPLRESKMDLDSLFEKYKTDLTSRNLEFGIVRGAGEERFSNALQLVESFLN